MKDGDQDRDSDQTRDQDRPSDRVRDRDRYWDCLDQAVEASHSGNSEEALAWLDEAIVANPEGAEAHNSRGEILWDDKRIDEALHEFQRSLEADPKFVVAHLNRAELLIEDLGEFEQAVQLCDELLSGSPELPKLDRTTEAEIYYLKAKAVFYLDDLEGALFLVRRALKAAGGDVPVYRAFDGQILFELGRYEEAKRSLDVAVALDSESSHAFYHMGLVLERLGAQPDADRAFARANALDSNQYDLPVRIGEQDFRRVAAEAFDNLPRSIREYVEDVPLLVEDWPSQELIDAENVSPQILGMYVGTPRTELECSQQAADLTRVILFKRNLEKVARDESELREQIQITVRHEIGHHLGLSEDDLERHGLA